MTCNYTIKRYKSFDDIAKEDIKEHNINWTKIPDHLYRILIIGSSGLGEANSLLSLTATGY